MVVRHRLDAPLGRRLHYPARSAERAQFRQHGISDPGHWNHWTRQRYFGSPDAVAACDYYLEAGYSQEAEGRSTVRVCNWCYVSFLSPVFHPVNHK